ncbi:MAG: hypothetical protein HONBIEJF_01051 [Fimbriimonadaceae bacterium]|nr:hypothetical protein [Fimbriimonadaceae bacterium]
MKFVANLRQETIDAFVAQPKYLAAYLLSSHRITPATLEAAAHVRALGISLFADNGTKPLIEQTIGEFEQRARVLSSELRSLRRRLGRVPRGRDVPREIRAKSKQLATDVVNRATKVSEAIDTTDLSALQLSMRPTDLIAQEDFAIGCLIGLGLEREMTGWSVQDVDRRNLRSLTLWRRVADDPRCADINVFAVLSAVDYNTARSAGRLASLAGVKNVAVGLAGIMLDSSATDFMVFDTACFKLAKPVARRYVRLAQVLRGFAKGFADTGVKLERLHCLGLGAPALFPIVAKALGETTRITADATSPIHDAVRDRVLYDPEKDGVRESTWEIVGHIVKGGSWAFLSPFTRNFRTEFGHHVGKSRLAWKALGRPPISQSFLEVPSEVTEALPLFSDAESAIQVIASKTRIAHNHWVLGQIAASLQDKKGRHRLALAAIDRWLSEEQTVTSRSLSVARRILFELTTL